MSVVFQTLKKDKGKYVVYDQITQNKSVVCYGRIVYVRIIVELSFQITLINIQSNTYKSVIMLEFVHMLNKKSTHKFYKGIDLKKILSITMRSNSWQHFQHFDIEF